MHCVNMADFEKKECPHCEILLTKKSYDAHRRLYYDDNTGWIKKRRLTCDEDHSRISATEQAIEQCAPEEDQTRIETDAPPLVDFGDEIAETTNLYEGDILLLVCTNVLWVGINFCEVVYDLTSGLLLYRLF